MDNVQKHNVCAEYKMILQQLHKPAELSNQVWVYIAYFTTRKIKCVWREAKPRLDSVRWEDNRFMMKWKIFGRKRLWPNRRIIAAIVWENWGKPPEDTRQDRFCLGRDSNRIPQDTNLEINSRATSVLRGRSPTDGNRLVLTLRHIEPMHLI
jgi:hypothetical protein